MLCVCRSVAVIVFDVVCVGCVWIVFVLVVVCAYVVYVPGPVLLARVLLCLLF